MVTLCLIFDDLSTNHNNHGDVYTYVYISMSMSIRLCIYVYGAPRSGEIQNSGDIKMSNWTAAEIQEMLASPRSL